MNRKTTLFTLVAGLICLSSASLSAGNFFSISSVEFERAGANGSNPARLKVRLQTGEATRPEQLYIRSYFFDEASKMVASFTRPSDVPRPGYDHYSMPAIFQKQKLEDVYFILPASLTNKRWTALVVFGDTNEAIAKTYGGNLSPLIPYPEKSLVENRSGNIVQRKAAIDPLVETLVNTGSKLHPQMTLFYRMPDGVSNPEETKGTLAMCLLAGNVGSIRRQLQGIDPGTEVHALLRYANERKLGVLCWGYQHLVNRNDGFERVQETDELAAAWEHGVTDLHTKYGIPARNYLLWGVCAAGDSATQLVFRKPNYFLAAFIHIPGRLEPPTPQANKVLWLLTTGELDWTYPGCINFYKQCRALSYPIIFKPISGMAHSDVSLGWGDAGINRSNIAYDLGCKFFDYALSLKEQRLAYDQALKDPITQSRLRDAGNQSWAIGFQNPAYYGDYLNQECYAANQANMIPAALRVPLPTKELADLWNK